MARSGLRGNPLPRATLSDNCDYRTGLRGAQAWRMSDGAPRRSGSRYAALRLAVVKECTAMPRRAPAMFERLRRIDAGAVLVRVAVTVWLVITVARSLALDMADGTAPTWVFLLGHAGGTVGTLFLVWGGQLRRETAEQGSSRTYTRSHDLGD